ncbi:MAG TPA: hypothetical protein DCQ31_03170, partial [Bacteroidales bacterium]|nr:hypothetical protein [Bacteroidales bacterium]
TIILNSTANLSKVISQITTFKACNAYLDNDLAGKEAFNKLQNNFSIIKNRANQIYPAFKDFNEFLCNGFELQKLC